MSKKTPLNRDTSMKTAAADAPPSNVRIAVSGPGQEARRIVTQMSFPVDWNQAVARGIALDQTLVADATLEDTLGGDRIRLFSQDTRDLYRQRCVKNAGDRGHDVLDPRQIPADSTTTVMEVGDALFKNARP
jgi:hypothetical protein